MEDVSGFGRLVAWDYAVAGIVLLATVLIGLYHAVVQRRKSSVTELLLAGRNMNVLPVALSVLATYFSAISLLGLPVEVFFYGTQQWMFIVSYLVVIPVSAYCLFPVFYEAGVTSAYEYLELRFSSVIRKIASCVYIIQTVLITVVVLYAPSLSISQVTGVSLWTSVGITGVTCIAYTAVGGMRAVLWTDTFQIIIMFISTSSIVIKGCIDMGGLQHVWERAQTGKRLEFFNVEFDPTLRQSFWSVAVGGIFTWLCTYGVSQSMVQRCLTTKNIKVAQRALWWNVPGLLVMTSLYCLTGLVIYARYWDCDLLKNGVITAKDQILPVFVMDVLGSLPGLPGLFIASIASATLSTMSSNLNGLTAVTLEDFIRPCVVKLSEKRATLLAKLIPVAYGGVAIGLVAVADRLGSIAQACISISGMVGGPLLGLFLLGMFLPWANSTGAFTGLLAGFAMATWIGVGSQLSSIPRPTLPVESGSCNWMNVSGLVTTTTAATNVSTYVQMEANIEPKSDAFPLFQLSFLWYSTVSCLTVFIVGAIISCFPGKRTRQGINPALLSPVVRWTSKYELALDNDITKVVTTNNKNNTTKKEKIKKREDDHSVKLENDTLL